MLHRLGSIFFLLAIISSFYKCFKFMNKRLGLNIHIATGTIGSISMIIYSVLDYIKEREFTILFVGIASILIIISGTSYIKKKYKYLHLSCVIGFALLLAFHIIH